MAKSRDLFDDSTMTFGEHLEVLRTHLFRAVVGLAICVVGSLFVGDKIIAVIRQPIDDALYRYGLTERVVGDMEGFDFWKYVKEQFGFRETLDDAEAEPAVSDAAVVSDDLQRQIKLELPAFEFAEQFHGLDPETYPPPSENLRGKLITIRAMSDTFARLRRATDQISRPVALNVQEAFLTYIKVAFIAGLVIASPWVFYQLWLFVAAGLYPHERHYVYTYLPMSLGLFLGGAFFCFYVVFPYVLDFLLGFNAMIGVQPQIRISEWISFAVTLPLMFGISFQLPLVMLFLERISVFEIDDYRQKRRMAILVIAILSMLLTPADPMSMMLMMLPLLGLYELGILLCKMSPQKSPFEAEMA